MAINYYGECLSLLSKLHQEHPSFSLGRHLSTALSEYGDVWGLSNKEILYALEKYQAEIDMENSSSTHDEYVDKVVREGMNLDTILDEEEDDDGNF
jgi:hypothetical protein